MTNDTQLRHSLYLSAVLALWDKGFDTWQIAQTLHDDQAAIERALHEGLAIRRRERTDAET